MNKIINNFEALIGEADIKSGMTISFHHHLREGDRVLTDILEKLYKNGIKDINLVATSTLNTHEKIWEYIKNGTVSVLNTSGLKGALAEKCINGEFDNPVIFRSHGCRARAVSDGELKIDIAFIAAAKCDIYGNATGCYGKNSFGSSGYGIWDSLNSVKTIIVTDDISETLLSHISINSSDVDFIYETASIGNNSEIQTGSLKPKIDTGSRIIASDTVKIITECFDTETLKIQMGSGGISTAVSEELMKKLSEKNKKIDWILGGITKYSVEMLKNHFVNSLIDVQSFSPECSESIFSDKNHHEIDVNSYANPKNKNAYVNFLDIAILSALEIDTSFNVNVLTASDGTIKGAIGGHQDVAEGSEITIITAPLLRGRIPIIVGKVKNIVTQGKFADILITDFGIAVNPLREDIKELFKNKNIPFKDINELRKIAVTLSGEITEPEFDTDKTVGIIHDRYGNIQSYIYRKVKNAKEKT